MQRTGITLACAVLLPGLALSGPLGARGGTAADTKAAPSQTFSSVGVPAAMTVTLIESEMGCKISVSARNEGGQTVAISRDSQVRIDIGGVWKKLGTSVWINPGQTSQWTYDLDFGCKSLRHWRFLVKQFDSNKNSLGDHWYYYGNNHATNAVSLTLGDLNRFF